MWASPWAVLSVPPCVSGGVVLSADLPPGREQGQAGDSCADLGGITSSGLAPDAPLTFAPPPRDCSLPSQISPAQTSWIWPLSDFHPTQEQLLQANRSPHEGTPPQRLWGKAGRSPVHLHRCLMVNASPAQSVVEMKCS